MGDSSTPDDVRGWGRMLLQNVLTIKGEGVTTMYFDDRALATSGKTTDYTVTVSIVCRWRKRWMRKVVCALWYFLGATSNQAFRCHF